MTTPLLEGTDGVEKMSKSLGNYIGVTEPPRTRCSPRSCRISDELMWSYYLLLTDLAPAEIEAERGAGRPMDSKLALARRIVADFHGAAAAAAAEAEWRRVHQQRQAPAEMPVQTLARRHATSRASSWSWPAWRPRRARPCGCCGSARCKRDGAVVEAASSTRRRRDLRRLRGRGPLRACRVRDARNGAPASRRRRRAVTTDGALARLTGGARPRSILGSPSATRSEGVGHAGRNPPRDAASGKTKIEKRLTGARRFRYSGRVP